MLFKKNTSFSENDFETVLRACLHGDAQAQIPLNLAYRGELGHNFAYFAGVGTNLTLKAKQNLSFDFKLPTNEFGEQRAERRVPFPLVNTMNMQLGAEKRWSPIVFQASLLLDNRLKTFPCLYDRTGLGIQVKVLYRAFL